MKKIIYYIFTCISLVSLLTCVVLKGTYYSFNPSNVRSNIEELSSEKYSGRLTGSDENYEVANLIKRKFDEYNLKPISEDYLEGFQVQSPYRNSSTPTLKLTYGDKTSKTFEYGVDYKEDLLNFKDSNITFNKSDSMSINSNSITFEKNLNTYIFYVSKDANFSFRSSFVNSSPYGFAIGITTETYNDILNALRNDETLEVILPFSINKKEVYNVAGKIEGLDPKLPPLVLTAHFDHLGRDALGNSYNGALDNASGTAFLLEAARTYSTLPRPERDIYFVALNAEEFGLLGSKNFGEQHKDFIANSKVINFDMVGVDNFPVTFMLGTTMKNRNSDLLTNLQAICNTKDIKNDVKYEDASDHASFNYLGIDSLTISHSDISKIHTPKDLPSNISLDGLTQIFEVINPLVLNISYDNPLFIFYDWRMLTCSFLFSVLFISYGVFNRGKRLSKSNNNLSA
ncbi:MAG: M28 family metallopeptidase [Clostridium sp.]